MRPSSAASSHTLFALDDHHAHAAHAVIQGSWLEIIEGVGHYPHCEAPERFVESLTEFIESTRPARIKVSRKRILRSPSPAGSQTTESVLP